MGATWPHKNAKGADPNNPPKGNPRPDYNKPYKYEYEWGQMGGTDVVECEILEDHVDTTYTIKFWDYNVNDWEIRRVQRDTVRGIYKPAPVGIPKRMHQAYQDSPDTCLWCGLKYKYWEPGEECRGHAQYPGHFKGVPYPNSFAVRYHPLDCPHNAAFDTTQGEFIVPDGCTPMPCGNCGTILGAYDPEVKPLL